MYFKKTKGERSFCMEDKKLSMGTYGGVANMEKVAMKPIQVAFMLYCLVAAGAFGLYAIVGTLFLQWYEGSWGAEYYLETYETGLISDFWLMLKVGRIGGVIGTLLGIILLAIGKKTDSTTWHGTGDWGVWASDKK